MNTKSIILAALALIPILLLAGWIVNQPPVLKTPVLANAAPCLEEPRTITVTGDADVRVSPDEVIITLGIETWNKNLDEAKSENDERTRQVLALTDDFDIEPRHIQTEYLSIDPSYENWENRHIDGFYVRKTIVITLKNISKFEDLITGVLEHGVNHIHGIQFRTTELRKYKDEARALAIKAAEEKAIALAGELGQDVGKPRAISENQTGWWSWYGSWWGSYWSGSMAQNVIQEVGSNYSLEEGTIAPGQITVNAKISATFELE
jgi:uncharacterized protein